MVSLKEFDEENYTAEYIKIIPGDNVIKFLDEGTQGVHEQFDTEGFRFEVEDQNGNVGDIFISSKRLLHELAKQDSLSGNTYVITRTGEKYSTKYRVRLFDGSNADVPKTYPDGKPMSEADQKEMFGDQYQDKDYKPPNDNDEKFF